MKLDELQEQILTHRAAGHADARQARHTCRARLEALGITATDGWNVTNPAARHDSLTPGLIVRHPRLPHTAYAYTEDTDPGTIPALMMIRLDNLPIQSSAEVSSAEHVARLLSDGRSL